MDELAQLRAAAAEHEAVVTSLKQVREALHDAIRAALPSDAPHGRIAEVARISGYDREHVRRIRNGDKGDAE